MRSLSWKAGWGPFCWTVVAAGSAETGTPVGSACEQESCHCSRVWNACELPLTLPSAPCAAQAPPCVEFLQGTPHAGLKRPPSLPLEAQVGCWAQGAKQSAPPCACQFCACTCAQLRQIEQQLGGGCVMRRCSLSSSRLLQTLILPPLQAVEQPAAGEAPGAEARLRGLFAPVPVLIPVPGGGAARMAPPGMPAEGGAAGAAPGPAATGAVTGYEPGSTGLLGGRQGERVVVQVRLLRVLTGACLSSQLCARTQAAPACWSCAPPACAKPRHVNVPFSSSLAFLLLLHSCSA